MTRRQLLSILITCTVASSLVFSAWTVRVWAGSKNIAIESQVLGASTSSEIELAEYPFVPDSIRMPYIPARFYALYHVQSGKVVVEKRGNEQTPIASTTKLMTSRLVMRYGELSDVVEASNHAVEQGGSIMGLRKGERMSVEDLLYGLMLLSGNDAAHTLAEYVGYKLLDNPQASPEEATERFIAEMNKEAESLGMTQTSYRDPAGLDDDGHSTAIELAKLTSLILQDSVLRRITTTAQRTVLDESGSISHDLRNSNRLVAEYAYQGASVGKTGFTPGAGHCLVASASRNGVDFIAVILMTDSNAKDASALAARQLLDWGFNSVQFQ